MNYQNWDSQVLQTAVLLAQKALQDALKPAGLEIPHRAPEAHRSWGVVPDQVQSAPHEMNSAAALIQNIVTTCDAALIAHFRHLSQRKRQSVLEEIQKAADAAKNALFQSGEDPLLVARMTQISGMSGQDLCQKLPALLESGLRLDVIACALHCDTDHILATIAEREAVIAQLQRQVATLRTQPGGHQDRVKHGEPVRPVASPPIPLPAGRGRLTEKMPPRHSAIVRDRDRHCGHCQRLLLDVERRYDVLCALKEVLKTQSIADVGVYDGSSSFDDFIRRLEMKYPGTLWSDEDRKKILLTHLGGSIRALIDTSPEIGRNTSYQSVVKFLREARRTPGERLQAEMDWKNLRIMDDESVADFVCRMRQIAKRMVPEQATDFQLGSKLYECLAHWKDSYYMLAALEAPEGQVFQEVRTVALRLERGIAPLVVLHQVQPDGRAEAGMAIDATDDVTSLSLLDPSRLGQSGQKQSLATLLDSWCAAIAVPGVPTKPFGKQCHCTIRIMGTTAKALIDTGSVLSIIPTGFLYPLKEKGEDLDSMVTLLGPPRDNSILDVSGNRMKFLMRLDTQVGLQPGGKEAKVQFHIQKADRQLILLGTNAL
ncbi:unnamed protein product [Heligmosomoides polygyrus]|uniref:Peptidase A2 domain-containing protein n=1 Tax=Heligmosomoides polygyrus TaxID=6339 RepID=A0A183GTL9_HELPZ|nr:unnamed protein product [Heligmosomoides polygyrus]